MGLRNRILGKNHQKSRTFRERGTGHGRGRVMEKQSLVRLKLHRNRGRLHQSLMAPDPCRDREGNRNPGKGMAGTRRKQGRKPRLQKARSIQGKAALLQGRIRLRHSSRRWNHPRLQSKRRWNRPGNRGSMAAGFGSLRRQY